MNTPVKPKGKIENFNNALNIPASPLLKQLGYGTGVEVYRLNRSPCAGKVSSPWALKYITKRKLITPNYPEINHRLNKEADILRKLDHPNIVGFRAFSNLSDGRRVLAMEDCQISLGDLIESRSDCDDGPFPASDISKMVSDMAAALHYLHSCMYLLHGDMKSHNILVKGAFNICKLCDFGVSLPLDQNGFVLPNFFYTGTELWSAPETLIDCKVTSKADIFSLGLSVWEMISLLPPHVPIYDDESQDSTLDESIDENSRNDQENKKIGTRPDLPDIHFGPEYNTVLESFYILTEQEPKNRPSATLLMKLMAKS